MNSMDILVLKAQFAVLKDELEEYKRRNKELREENIRLIVERRASRNG